MKKLYFICIGLLLAAGLTWVVLKHQPPASVAAPAPESATTSVETVRIEKTTMIQSVDIYGSLAPKLATQVRVEIPGTVQSIRVKEWDKVKTGDTLLQLDPMDVSLAVQQAKASHQMALAQETQAKVDLDRAQREWDRSLRLKQGGLITAQECDERLSALEAARARLELARAQVSQAAARLAEVSRSLQKMTVVSPIQGTVSQRHVDIGHFVDKGAALFTIVDNRILDLTATVAAVDLVSVHEGQQILFSVDGFGDRTFEGTVKRINPVVDATDRSGKIVAEVANSGELLRGGLFVRGRIVVKRHENAAVLPKSGLVQWDLQQRTASVLVVNAENIIESRAVSTGMSDEQWVEIRSGIDPTDRVVIRGGFTVKPGDKVRVSQQSPALSPAQEKENG
ncbi:efflux RND transporter periplasmic adaptor subunit [Desulfatirhabdium butyrativorans]|uniref:efflux RND transporter periplasmic adaptor subunit n=1 Tax=Desulfatirhabdium butyrativorans TaxID=340467 RepID=UPI00040F84D6|nr:efflux RND transporter periplasmic adaptor subunit [Desulfatirhabdium butyrativorans]